MRAPTYSRPLPWLVALTAMLAAALALAWPTMPQADAADPRLERAQQHRQRVQAQLDEVLQRLRAVEAEVSAAEAQLAQLQAQEQAYAEAATAATGALAYRVRESYKRGNIDPTLAMLAASSPQQAAQHARVLGILAVRSRDDVETATSARIQTRVSAEDVERAAETLRARRAEVEAVRADVARLLAEAEQQEQGVRKQLAAEQAARDRAARATQQRASRASRGAAGAAAPITGGVACPIGTPRSYRDTYGAPRSGGRSHKGTDIMAPRGTPIYAYENGAITRMNSSRVGGISIYMRGDSGNLYYYTHLQGYVSGISAGQRVSVGQHIAFNGDTGNARGIPHLHFEVMPGGGRNVNPYPYVRRACG